MLIERHFGLFIKRKNIQVLQIFPVLLTSLCVFLTLRFFGGVDLSLMFLRLPGLLLTDTLTLLSMPPLRCLLGFRRDLLRCGDVDFVYNVDGVGDVNWFTVPSTSESTSSSSACQLRRRCRRRRRLLFRVLATAVVSASSTGPACHQRRLRRRRQLLGRSELFFVTLLSTVFVSLKAMSTALAAAICWFTSCWWLRWC